MNKEEQAIWNDMFCLHQMFARDNPENDAYKIFQLSFSACQILVQYNNHPLAIRLSQALVNYYIDRWTSAHRKDGESGIVIRSDCWNYS